jgi:polyisoprenoid-binding protein YceI
MGLASCQTTPPQGQEVPQAEPALPAPGTDFPIPADAREYRVDAAASLLQVLVYRGGAMARLGHNHVIASHHLAGSVWLTGDPLATRFDIRFPVNELTIDEPALREAVGSPDFPAQVPQSAREGTRTNLLSGALLDGAHHAEIRLRATDVRGANGAYDVGVQVTFKDSNYSLRVPVTVSREAGAVVASGEFPLRQSDLGLKPFSVAMGTLVVLDDMKVRFRLTARP